MLNPAEVEQQPRHIPLFVLTTGGALDVITDGDSALREGDRLVALLPAAEEQFPLRADSAVTGAALA